MRQLLITLLLLFSSTSWASEYQKTLDNGFSYTLNQVTESSGKIELRLVIKAGSLSEKDNQRGYAHLLEHMAFNGTKHFPKKDIHKLFHQAGLRLGHGFNALTYMDRTVYILSLPKSNTALLEQSLLYLRDILTAIEFDQNELDLEKGVVKNEYLVRHQQEETLLYAAYDDHIQGSQYAERLPLGNMEVIEEASDADLKAFYHTWYRPDNARLLVIGDQDNAHTSRLIEHAFADIKPVKVRPQQVILASPKFSTEPAAYSSKVIHTAESWLFFDLPEQRLNNVNSVVEAHQIALTTELVNYRLNRKNEQRKTPFSQVNVMQLPLLATQPVLAVRLLHQSTDYNDAAEFIGEELARLQRYGFTKPEFALQLQSKKVAQANLQQNYANLTSAQIADYIEQAWAKEEMVQDLAIETEVYHAFFQQTHLAGINQLAKTIFSKSGKWVYAYPQDISEPDVGALHDSFVTAGLGNISPPQADPSPINLPLFSVLPNGSKIKSQTFYEPLDITQWQLENGVTVLLQPDKSANGRIYIDMTAPGGIYGLTEEQLPGLSVFLSSFQGRGLAGLSAQQLHQKLKADDVFLQPYVNPNGQGLYFESGQQGLETAFSTLNAAFTQANLDSKVFQTIKAGLVEQQANALKLPAVKAQQKLFNTLYPGNPYESFRSVEQIKGVSQQDVDALYQHFFASANGYRLTIVGDFELDNMKPLVESYITSLPAGQRHVFATRALPFIKKSSSLSENVNPQRRADLAFIYLFDKAEASIDEVYAADLIGRIVHQRLMDKVREELSLTYTPSAWCTYRMAGTPYSTCNINITSEPKDAGKTKQAVTELITQLVREGVSDKELAQHKKALSQGMESTLKSVKDRHRLLHRDSMYGFPVGSVYRSQAIIDRLDIEFVHRLLKVYFNPQHHVTFTSLPAS